MKKSLILMTAAAMLLMAIPAYAQPSISNVAQAKSSDRAVNYTWGFEVKAGKTESSGSFYPTGDRITLKAKQSSDGNTKIEYTLYEETNRDSDTEIASKTVRRNHDEKLVFEDVLVNKNKKHYVVAHNLGDETTKGVAYISR
ncbi:hypothetical protein [Paenibacillus alvei]|uniref:Uncharacterized protein n=1 Tax=Paenibacillus alvei TaxID=44250 RepID=A0AAP7A0V7_PAEAL|nr:hypothetical protein [Paenibacillus alvei]NOJ73549.1 hypothetical protein [Paenibacillus alvei]